MRLAIRENIVVLPQDISLMEAKIIDEYQLPKNAIKLSGKESVEEVVLQINKALEADSVTLRDMFVQICEENHGKKMITFDGVCYNYEQVKKEVEELVVSFYGLGVRKGTRVAIILDNSIEYIHAFFALFYIGALPVPINIRWKKEELFRVLDNAEISYIICSEKAGNIAYGEFVAEYIASRKNVKNVIYLNNNLYGEKGVLFLSLYSGGKIEEITLEPINPLDVGMISYTSGTTGIPKGVLLKHNDIYKISKYSAEYWCVDRIDKPFSIAPLYSAQGFLSMLINFATECEFKMISSFNPNDIIKEISKCENTIIHTQPTMWNLLLNCRIINFASFEQLNTLVVSGSLCSPSLAKRIEEKLGCRLMNAYGLVEGTSVVTMTRLDDPEEIRFNTVGRPIEGIQIKIVDPDRNEVVHGEIGELAIKGYNMAGYYKNSEKTNEVMDEEGWLYTGDLARYYDDENISIVGRCKDMIIRGGFNVYPSDIEEYLLQMSNIHNAAVIGKENEILGEEILAFIVVKAGCILSEREVLTFLFNRLANYKIPDKVYFVSEMPIILAGKVDKKLLKDWAEHGIPEDKKVLFKDWHRKRGIEK